MYDTKLYMRNPKIRAVLWLSAAILIFGGPLLIGVLYEDQQRQEESIAAATDLIEASTATARQVSQTVGRVS